MGNSLFFQNANPLEVTPFGTKIPTGKSHGVLTPELMAQGAANAQAARDFMAKYGIPLFNGGGWGPWGGSGGGTTSPPPPPAPSPRWAFPDYTQDWAGQPPASFYTAPPPAYDPKKYSSGTLYSQINTPKKK